MKLWYGGLKKEAERLYQIDKKYGLLKDLASAELDLVNYKCDYLDNGECLFFYQHLKQGLQIAPSFMTVINL